MRKGTIAYMKKRACHFHIPFPYNINRVGCVRGSENIVKSVMSGRIEGMKKE